MPENQLCNYPNCFPVDGGCEAGEPQVTACSHFHAQSQARENPPSKTNINDFASVYWTGSAFGGTDVAKLAARGRLVVIAIVGASGVGKTNALATLYLQLLNGERLEGYRFAGSLTLGGWEALADPMRWGPGGVTPNFPDHTPRGAARQPGLLHLALRDCNDQLRDVVFADAPGEWFERWAVDQAHDSAEGARWLERHADAVAIFLDSAKLANPEERGSARHQSQQLLTRIGAAYKTRPRAAIWAKHDCFEENLAVAAVRSSLETSGISQQFETVAANASEPIRGVLELFVWLIDRALEGVSAVEPSLPRSDAAFFGFRGRA